MEISPIATLLGLIHAIFTLAILITPLLYLKGYSRNGVLDFAAIFEPAYSTYNPEQSVLAVLARKMAPICGQVMVLSGVTLLVLLNLAI